MQTDFDSWRCLPVLKPSCPKQVSGHETANPPTGFGPFALGAEGVQVPGWFPVPVFGRTGGSSGVRRVVLMVLETNGSGFTAWCGSTTSLAVVPRNPGVWECGLSRSRQLLGGNRGWCRAVSRQGSRDPLVCQRVVPDTSWSSWRQCPLAERMFVRRTLLLGNKEPRRKG